MPDVAFGNTETVILKQDLVSSMVQRELIAGSILAPRVMDVSSFCVPGAQTIEFPKAGNLTVVNRAEGVAGDAAVITYGTDILPLDQNAYVSWIVDYKSAIQSSINVQLDLASRAAKAHAKNVDDRLILQLEAAGDATATAGVLSYDILLEMMTTFITRFGDRSLQNATYAVGPATWALLMDMDEFKRAEVYGSATIPSGLVGSVLGAGVVVHPSIAASTYYLFDRQALALGFQAGASYSEQMANEYGSQAMRAVLDQIFGVKGMFINQAGAGVGESALIIKDAN